MSKNRIKKHFKVSFGFRSSRATQKKSRASSSGHHPGRISDATSADNGTVLLSNIKTYLRTGDSLRLYDKVYIIQTESSKDQS